MYYTIVAIAFNMGKLCNKSKLCPKIDKIRLFVSSCLFAGIFLQKIPARCMFFFLRQSAKSLPDLFVGKRALGAALFI